MQVFIVYAHPERKSFNGAMLETAQEYFSSQGDTVELSDLYQMGFDPVSDRRNFTTIKDSGCFKQQLEEVYAAQNDGFVPELRTEMEKLERCDLFVMQFPLWWFGMPAILKGWVDRVFAMGRIYGSGKWYDEGALKGKRAMLSVTTGGPSILYASEGLNGDIDHILFPINHGILRFTGFDVLPPFVAWGPGRADADARASYLENYRERLAHMATDMPISYRSLSDYDLTTFERKRPDA